MRVLLSTYGSRWDVEPMVGLAELLARVGVLLVPTGQPVRPRVTGAPPPSAAHLPPRGAESAAAQFDTVAAVAQECDEPVATGVMPTGVWR